MDPNEAMYFALQVHQMPFVWMAVFVAVIVIAALFFALIVQIVSGERSL
jgi:hypothetical protein